jgi:hypothetical protein
MWATPIPEAAAIARVVLRESDFAGFEAKTGSPYSIEDRVLLNN